MKFSSFKFFLEEAVKSLVRNGLMTISSIITVSACILIVIISYSVAINVDFLLKQAEASGGLAVSVAEELNAEGLMRLKEQLLSTEHIVETEFVDKEQALREFSETLGDNKGILAGFEGRDVNPLPRSFVITIDDVRNQADVVKALSSRSFEEYGVTKVRHSLDFTEPLVSFNGIVRLVSVFFILVLALLGVTIIMNTIKLTVNSRRHEISIMKYVGATDWFIRWPFIIEGVVIGVCGAIVPVVACWLLYDRIIGSISDILFIQSFMTFRSSIEFFPYFAPICALLGIVIGGVGSITSIRKYLDV